MSLIVLEGLDKSGKKTQVKILAEMLVRQGYSVECIAFPDYKTILGNEIKKFLDEKVDFSPRIRQLLFVANRWEREEDIRNWIAKGKIVIADRYTPSGIVYGLANDLDLNWIIKLEEGLTIPKIIIVIDASIKTIIGRMSEKADLYEKNRQFLEKVRDFYLKIAKKFKWTIIDGDDSIENVTKKIWDIVSSNLNSIN